MADVRVPTIYFWEDFYNNKPEKMTAAFKWRGMCFGESFPIDDTKLNKIRKRGDKNRLIEKVKEALDIVVHHGSRVLDSDGNINPKKVNDAEAERFWIDPEWRNKIIALRKIIIVKDATKEEVIKLGLL